MQIIIIHPSSSHMFRSYTGIIYGSTALVDLGRFLSFVIYKQSVGHLGRGSVRRKAGTHTQNSINTE
jgi:hypothetical protein